MLQPVNTVNEYNQPIGYTVTRTICERPSKAAVFVGQYCKVEPLDMAKHGADLSHAFVHDTKPEDYTYMPYGPFLTKEECTSYFVSVEHSADPFFYAIVDKSSGVALGIASYMRIKPFKGVVEVGFVQYSPLLQRTRMATEAMYLMMKNAFDLGYRRYEWKCDDLNERSMASAIRLGFTFEGTFRQHIFYKGRNRDTAWLAVLDCEWPSLRKSFENFLSPTNFDAEGRQRNSLNIERFSKRV
eukprot:CFRG3769T1